MAIETSAGAAFGFKAGLFGALAMGFVSILAVLIGFTVVPLTPGKEHQDATRRLGAGLLCSFTLGPPLAIKFLEWQPSILTYWVRLLGPGNEVWAYLMGAVPFVAVTALAGFWIVAGFMRWFTNRQGQDIGQMAIDAAQQAKQAKELLP
jgi:hypothetical protein